MRHLKSLSNIKFTGLKGILIVLFLAGVILAYYNHLSNKIQDKDETEVKISAVEEVLSRNLTTNYPSTPKEVIKYFSEITKCYYNEDLSDDDIVALGTKMLGIYDDSLIENNNFDAYIFNLKSDINFYKTNGYTIASFAPSPSTDVERFYQDDAEWARTWCMYSIKSGKYLKSIQEVFILRKDDKGHWKIFGWQEVNE